MNKTSAAVLALSIAGVLSASAAFAYRELQPAPDLSLPPEEMFSMDAPLTPETVEGRRIESVTPTFPNPWNVTHETVGDGDTFGRATTYLGLMSNYVVLSPQCPRANAAPNELCQPVTNTSAWTQFTFKKVSTLRLPAASTHSMLCHWLTPILDVNYYNNSGAPAMGRIFYTPTITVRNPVLDDPSLINPITGQPFAGSFDQGLSFNERLGTALYPGLRFNERTRKSTVCIAGMLTRQSLIRTYGLSEAQADRFLASPMTIEMNVTGWTQHVESAWISLNMRVMGDSRM